MNNNQKNEVTPKVNSRKYTHEQRLKKFKHKAWVVPLAVAFALFGFLMTVQYNTQVKLSNSLLGQDTETLVTLVKSMTDRRTKLEAEHLDLQAASETLDVATALENQIKQLEIFNGTTDVAGPGITVVLTGDSPFLNFDLVDIVNELWVSGAEAIAINDIRVLSNTSIIEATDENSLPMITINKQKILTPVVIKAIGKPETLEKGLTFTGGILDNLNTLYNVYPTLKQEKNLTIPKSSRPNTTQYKKKVEPKEIPKPLPIPTNFGI